MRTGSSWESLLHVARVALVAQDAQLLCGTQGTASSVPAPSKGLLTLGTQHSGVGTAP